MSVINETIRAWFFEPHVSSMRENDQEEGYAVRCWFDKVKKWSGLKV